ncbi:uncharacterized protein LOC121101714 isoform X1 [Ursus maritimus]|uniref:Uncharacterized protein LOC121101714 isoform X1 n=2 Tax=Ursus maritimus TaxID=29073 RepID=A0A8M1FIX3_URSMA|nr:uncharacterized protein LOC121101714 isoform X1 [Ursus maritimus]
MVLKDSCLTSDFGAVSLKNRRPFGTLDGLSFPDLKLGHLEIWRTKVVGCDCSRVLSSCGDLPLSSLGLSAFLNSSGPRRKRRMLTRSGDGLNEESAIPGGGGLGLKQPGPTLETLSSRGSGAGTQPLAECLTVRETKARGRRTRPRPRKRVPEEATLEHSIYGSVCVRQGAGARDLAAHVSLSLCHSDFSPLWSLCPQATLRPILGP